MDRFQDCRRHETIYNPRISFTPGVRIGPYEIVSTLGAGGMGEVYRARDTKLNRDVAIKVLLPAVANDPDRLARFSREAQVLASLNHPNIAAIYGIEDIPADVVSGFSRTTALVMELVEGEDLSQRIARGAIPIDEALPIARQIAEALEAAHDLGIIHRDLKPANIKLRSDGTVKVLDFGLAKAIDPTAGSSANAMNSPTLSIHATEAGVILGTAAYMSPEQAKGKSVDRRADIWAFGAVLFEMLTGKRAFAGDDISDTLVSVLRDEPDWSALAAGIPAGVTQALHVCLRKDPKQRVRDISAVRLAMEGAFGTTLPPAESAVQVHGSSPVRRRFAIAAVALVAAGAAGVLVWALMRSTPEPIPPIRFAVDAMATIGMGGSGNSRDIAVSPDGARLAFGGGLNSKGLSVRSFDQLAVVELSGTGGAHGPFFSVDSRWIGFFNRVVGSGTADLKKVSITGGPAIVLCRINGDLLGASWAPDDTIVFATSDRTTGLLRVLAGGGEPTVLTVRDEETEVDHILPFVLPGGRAVLFTIVPHGQVADDSQIAVLDFATGERKILIRGGSHAEYVGPSPDSAQSGFLVYAAAGTLRAVRFDPARLVVLSDPVPVVDQVMTEANGVAEFSVSRTGVLAYAQGGMADSGSQRTLVWVDRQGREEPIDAPPLPYVIPRISPDGTRIALDIRSQNNDIWTWDLARKTMARLTFDSATDLQPVWTPDSRRILFSSTRNGPPNVYWHAADGTGQDQRVTNGARAQYPSSVTPDGTQVLGHESSGIDAFDVVQMPLSADSSPSPSVVLVRTPFMEFDTQLSPDGRHIAYQSNESGRPEIYVRPYPNVNDGRWQISNSGGTRPAWARNGREVFYVDAGGTLTAVPVQASGGTFTAGKQAAVFATKYETLVNVRNYDVSADGRRFLMIKADPRARDRADRPNVIMVLNWMTELNARVPVAK